MEMAVTPVTSVTEPRTNRAKWWVWREVKANMAGALRHPVGFMLCVVLSSAPARLGYYYKRLAGKDD